MIKGFPGGSVVKNLPASGGHLRSIPGLRRSPGEGNGNQPQYTCHGQESHGQRSWQGTVHGVEKSQTRLTHTFTFFSEKK